LTVVDELGTRTTLVTKPALVCTEADENGTGTVDGTGLLTCYKTKDASGQPPLAAQSVNLQNDLGASILSVSKPNLLCISAWR
jgi:hypothetical protein